MIRTILLSLAALLALSVSASAQQMAQHLELSLEQRRVIHERSCIVNAPVKNREAAIASCRREAP